jgi:hypothetical protein
MSSGRTVQGMANMAATKGYLVAAAKSDHSSELSLYVTEDTETWHHAEFGDGKIEEDAYTILESTNYSIQVDVMSSKYTTIGSLYTSNSNGTYFTKNVENTNRNALLISKRSTTSKAWYWSTSSITQKQSRRRGHPRN